MFLLPSPAEAGKFPLRDAVLEGRAQALQDRGFSGSQDAAVPELWFEAGKNRHCGLSTVWVGAPLAAEVQVAEAASARGPQC